MIEPDTPPPLGRWIVLAVLIGVGWLAWDRLAGDRRDELAGALKELAREVGWESPTELPRPESTPPTVQGADPEVVARELDPIRVGPNVRRPRKISGPDPGYTEMARKGRIQGVVIIEAIIDRRGHVASARVLKPLPMGLDEAALEAVRQWKFEPAVLHGEPVDVYYNLTVNYRLE